MKLYRVENTTTGAVQWVTSSGAAGKTRSAFVEAGAKRAEIDTQEHDIDTTKAGLLEWLNKHQI
jgi:hypothetical protein